MAEFDGMEHIFLRFPLLCVTQKEEMKEFEEPDKELRLMPPPDAEICPYDVTAIPSNQNQNNLFNMETYQENLKRE